MNKRISTLCLLCLALLGVLPSAHADKWALLIGIDQYADTNRINPLGAAAADAKAMATTLHDVAGFESNHIQLLVSDGEIKPEKSNIIEGLARLVANAKPGDTVFVMFSGHGVQIDDIPYLLPYDTKAFSPLTLAETALRVSVFREQLSQIQAKALILSFDMCRSSPQKTGKAIGDTDNMLSSSLAKSLDFKTPVSNGEAQTASKASAIITLFSCSRNERSYEWAQEGRGYFSYYLEQGLRGKAADASGIVTGRSLANYVSRQVQTAVKRFEHTEQTPYPSLDGSDAETFALSDPTSRTQTTGMVATVKPKKLNTRAQLTVDVDVAEASIAVDGEPILGGSYAANLLDEAEKEVKVTITAPGYEPLVMSVTLRRGKTEPLKVTLNTMAVRTTNTSNGAAAAVTIAPLQAPYFLNAAISASNEFPGAEKASILAIVARSQTALGDSERGKQSVAEANKNLGWSHDEAINIGPHTSVKGVKLVAVAQAQIALNNIESAKSTLREAMAAARFIDNFYGRPGVMAAIAVEYAHCGDNTAAKKVIQEAIVAVRRSENIAQTTSVLMEIAGAQFIAGDSVGAHQTIAQANKSVLKLPPWENAEVYSAIAQAQAVCGDFDDALATIKKITNIHRKGEAIDTLAEQQAKRGDITGALQTLSTTPTDPGHARALVLIAQEQGKRGDANAAKTSAERLTAPFLKAEAFAKIAEAMATTKKPATP